MPSQVRKLTAAAVAIALIAVPTGAIAAAPAIPQATAQQATAAATTNPWLALSAMTSSSSTAASAAAAQGDSGPGFPPIPALVVILGTIALAIWILAHDEDGDVDFGPEPVSP
jgi:hypothetical protein